MFKPKEKPYTSFYKSCHYFKMPCSNFIIFRGYVLLVFVQNCIKNFSGELKYLIFFPFRALLISKVHCESQNAIKSDQKRKLFNSIWLSICIKAARNCLVNQFSLKDSK